MKNLPCVYYCCLASSKYLLPYFVRSRLLDSNQPYDDPDVREALSLSLQEFSDRVEDRSLPDDFYNEDTVELQDDTRFYIETNFDGAFALLKELVPPGVQLESADPEYYDNWCNEIFCGDAWVYTIPLRHQASIFAASPLYDNKEAVLKEVKTALTDAKVELPDNFAYWRVVGRLEGVMYVD